MTVLLVVIFYRRLLFTTFDPDVAPIYGIRTDWVDTIFSLILAATIVVSMQVMGVTLIAAAIVIPPVTARLLTYNFHLVILISTGIGAATGFVGMYSSYYVDVSSGANIVLTGAAAFAAAMVYSSVREHFATRRGIRPSAPALEQTAAEPGAGLWD